MKSTTKSIIAVFLILSAILSCSSTNGVTDSDSAQIYDFDTGLQMLSKMIIDSLKNNNLFKIAINDFIRIDEKQSVLGKAISEELVTGFFIADAPFDLVERKQLESALDEMSLGRSGLIDESKAAELGRMLGADALVIGSITPFETYYKLNARIFAVQDGKVASAASVKIRKTPTTEEMYNNLLSVEPLTDAGKNGNETEPKPVVEQKDNQYEQEIEDFLIKLESVYRKGAKIWTEFIVTYNGTKSEEFIGFFDARIIDTSGNEYEPVSGGTLQPWDDWGGLTCVPGIPMAGNIPFEVGVADISQIVLLEVEFRNRGKLYFRDVFVH